MDGPGGLQNGQDALNYFIDAGPVWVNTILLIEEVLALRQETIEHGIVFSRQC